MHLTLDTQGLADYLGNLEIRTMAFQRKNLRTQYKNNDNDILEEKEIVQIRMNYLYPKINAIINNNKLQVLLTIPNIVIGTWLRNIDLEVENYINQEETNQENKEENLIDIVLQDPLADLYDTEDECKEAMKEPIENNFEVIKASDMVIDIGENINVSNPHEFFYIKKALIQTINKIVIQKVMQKLNDSFPELAYNDNLLYIETSEIFEGEEENPPENFPEATF